MILRVDPVGWSYHDWEGTVYPRPKPPRFDPLAYLENIYDTIEIKSSFYRPLAIHFAESWVRRVRCNLRFKFTAKVWNRLAHERKAFSKEDVDIFFDEIEVQSHMSDRFVEIPPTILQTYPKLGSGTLALKQEQ